MPAPPFHDSRRKRYRYKVEAIQAIREIMAASRLVTTAYTATSTVYTGSTALQAMMFATQCTSLRRLLRAGIVLVLVHYVGSNAASALEQAAEVLPALLEEAAQHLQLEPGETLQEAPAWGFDVHLSRELLGAGFHQTVAFNISAPAPAEASTGTCRLALLQPLPSDFYADPYQLEDLARTRGNFEFKLFGPLDLELPAPVCQPTLLLLDVPVVVDRAQYHAALEVPLHVKYPEPKHFAFQGWRWLLSGYATPELPLPWLVLRCSSRDSTAGGQASRGTRSIHKPPASSTNNSSTKPLVWHVPAGNLDHLPLTSWGTTAATMACCAAATYSVLSRRKALAR